MSTTDSAEARPPSHNTCKISKSSATHRSNRRVRAAYFNTTRGLLTGRPDDNDVEEIRQALYTRDIAYLFNADATRPRPMFSTSDRDSIGLEEIMDHLDELAKPR